MFSVFISLLAMSILLLLAIILIMIKLPSRINHCEKRKISNEKFGRIHRSLHEFLTDNVRELARDTSLTKNLYIKHRERQKHVSNPIINDLIKNHDSHIYAAYILVLEPNTFVPIRRWGMPSMLRYHVFLDVPKQDAGISFDFHRYSVEKHEIIVSNSSLHNNLWNQSKEGILRVLILDVYRNFSPVNGIIIRAMNRICNKIQIRTKNNTRRLI